ncbi:MAG: hypothetical protein KF718_04290 [Polyangiaceae bacterium]|nr:hypothetical protein [Polyangiaceae bacterium]
MKAPSTIAAAEVGPVVLEGVARSDGRELLLAPLSSRPCIAYRVAGRASGHTQEQGARDFLLEDETGSVLVSGASVELALGQLHVGASIQALDADIHEVSAELAKLKTQAKRLQGKAASDARRELRELRGLYTLLCAIRAHANGKCHVGKSLAGQERYIEERSQAYQGKRRELATIHLMRHETILEEGARVRVEGELAIEASPVDGGGGYRDRATHRVVRAPKRGSVNIVAEGSELVRQALEKREAAPAQRRRRAPPPIVIYAAWALALGAGLLVWRYAFSR